MGCFILFCKQEYFYSEDLPLEVLTRSNCQRTLCSFFVISESNVLTISLPRPSCFFSEVSVFNFKVFSCIYVDLLQIASIICETPQLVTVFICFVGLYCFRVLLLLNKIIDLSTQLFFESSVMFGYIVQMLNKRSSSFSKRVSLPGTACLCCLDPLFIIKIKFKSYINKL